MARLHTDGFELGPAHLDAGGWAVHSTITGSTTNPRSGSACVVTSAANAWLSRNNSGVVSTSFFARVYVRPAANPTGQTQLVGLYTAAGPTWIGTLNLETNGTVTLRNGGSAGTVLTTSAAIPVGGVYTMLELGCAYPASGAPTLTLRVNGVVVGSGASGISTLFDSVSVVNETANVPGTTVSFDDWALNDSTGAAQNTYPGEGKVIFLKATSDNAVTGWTTGTGGTTSLFAAVSNLPPTGVANASATATSQIKDSTANTTDTYAANLQTYTAAGLGANDVVMVAIPHVIFGSATAAASQIAIQMTSNPAITEVTSPATGASAVGTWPGLWTLAWGTFTYNPSVAMGTAPVMRVRKATSAVTEDVTLMSLLVEYVPARSPTVIRRRPIRSVQRPNTQRGRF